ncbi:MAG: DUF805 domain-containing protein [Campylobacterales bacterium]|nr:DUF805 domain-containing protein [Campylobacterales bacterium]
MDYFKAYFIDILKSKYLQFEGRAPRREFWYFVLFSFIISFILGFIEGFLGLGINMQMPTGETETISILQILFSLIILLPSIAISIRRLHDIGKSGWWYILGVIPFVNLIGIFVLLYFFITPSQEGDNEFGPFTDTLPL